MTVDYPVKSLSEKWEIIIHSSDLQGKLIQLNLVLYKPKHFFLVHMKTKFNIHEVHEQ